MPNPVGLNTTLLHMHFVEPNAEATPLQGSLSFTPNPSPILFPDQNVIVSGTETVTLDVNGEATIELVSTGAAGNVDQWLYTVTERITGQRARTYNIALPFSSGVTLELADIEPSENAPTFIPVMGPQGPPGVITEINGYSAAIVILTAADVDAVDVAQIGAANGVASLNATGKIPLSQYDGASVLLASVLGAASGAASLDASSHLTASQLNLATSPPPSVGTGAVGSSSSPARADHTHDGVALTGAQTVAGLKTFSSGLAVSAGTNGGLVHIKHGVDINLLTVEQTNTSAAAGVMKLVAGSATNQAFLGSWTGAATNSWSIRADGRLEAGDGTNARDTFFVRTAAGAWLATSQVRVSGSAPSDPSDLTRKDYVDNNFVTVTTTQTISGTKTFTGPPNFNRASTGSLAFQTSVSSDTFGRLAVNADGKMAWGPGNTAGDVTLSRSAVGILALVGELQVQNAAASNAALATVIGGNGFDSFRVYTDGLHEWGSGTAARDTNLYRNGVNQLKTDDDFVVAGTLSSATSGINYRAVQSGSQTVNFSAAAQVDATVTFPVAFASAPIVQVSINNSPSGSSKITARATSVTATGFTLRFVTGDSTTATATGVTGVWTAYIP